MLLGLNEALHKYNAAVGIMEKQNYKKAITKFKEVLKIVPAKEAYNNIGVCYRALGQDKLMFENYRLGLSDKSVSIGNIKSVTVQLLNNLGLAEYMYGNDATAIKHYTKAIHLDKEAWDAWWNCSTAKLRVASGTGEGFGAAWQMYKARFLKNGGIKLKNSKKDLVYWDTISNGSSIIVLTEQGLGDAIMFGRYLPLLAKKFSTVYVQTANPELFPGFPCVTDAVECSATVAYPICSLGECFPEIPPATWLRGYDTHDFGGGFNIGIVWSGNPKHANNAYRSVDVRRFHRLSRYGNLYSLQYGFTGDKVVKPLEIRDWSDTARYINGLDLVIGVDTSVMHMVGSLGRPGWLLQPYKETDFRWGNPLGEFGSSVWYPEMKIFNNPQSWETVFDRVEECLKSHVAELAVPK